MPEGIEVRGLMQLNRALEGLEKKAQKNAIRAAVRAGGRVIVKEARRRLPSEYGTLKKSITVKVLRGRPTSQAAIVGPSTAGLTRAGKTKRPKNDGWYGHIVEFGTLGSRRTPLAAGTKRRRKYKSGLPKGLAPHPFLRPAIAATKNKVVKVFIVKLDEAIKKQLAKANK